MVLNHEMNDPWSGMGRLQPFYHHEAQPPRKKSQAYRNHGADYKTKDF
ncbi:40287_t:CDS:2, partial [Gigaspora margarita]